jgi:hypothetical protein
MTGRKCIRTETFFKFYDAQEMNDRAAQNEGNEIPFLDTRGL